jgi:hypothetical protein
MRKLITTLATAGVLGMSGLGVANAAPAGGYDDLYAAVITSCSLPAGTLEACEAAINGYSSALVVAVTLPVANQSFSEARKEVFALNAADEEFQAAIDALFELLLPDSGAILPIEGPGFAPTVTGTGEPPPASPS